MFKFLAQLMMMLPFLMPNTSFSQESVQYQPPYFANQDRLAKIQHLLPTIKKMYADYAKSRHIPGYAFGIMLDGKMIYSGSGGYAEIDKKILATPKTLFRIASMSKSFTAMAILKLRDEGDLSLEGLASTYISELKNQKLALDSPEITIRDLLTHSSGLPQDDPWGDRHLAATDADLIAILKKGINFSNATGTHFEYSNLGFTLLGHIISEVSHQPFQEYIRSNIWQPLQMKKTEWEFAQVPQTELAHGYKWHNGHWKAEPMLHDGSFAAMGGIITSIEDFSHYIAFHQMAWPARDDTEIGPLKRSSVREMHQAHRLAELNLDTKQCAKIYAYGFGLRYIQDCFKRVFVGHSGGLPGFGSNWFIMPDYGLGVMLFTNLTYADTADVNLKVLNFLVKKAQLDKRKLPISHFLKDRKAELIELLPNWDHAEQSQIFAENFFLDNPILQLKKQTKSLFRQAGKIKAISELDASNQLRGSFILKGANKNIKIFFTLAPEKPSRIQAFTMTLA